MLLMSTALVKVLRVRGGSEGGCGWTGPDESVLERNARVQVWPE